MRKVTSILKNKRFIAAAFITAVTIGVIVIQKKAKPTIVVSDAGAGM
jgi:hypothetical protein